MRKRIAKWLVSLAKRLDRNEHFALEEYYEPVQLGVAYHIGKKDVLKYRKEHSSLKSHRKGLDALIADTKDVILRNIAQGLVDKKVLEYKVRKNVWVADVEGKVVVYRLREQNNN